MGVCFCGGKVRWNKGQEECLRCGRWLISRPHGGGGCVCGAGGGGGLLILKHQALIHI